MGSIADKLSGVLVSILIVAVFIGAVVGLMFTNLAHIAHNITEQGGVVGSLGILFLIIIPILLVFALFKVIGKVIDIK